MADVAVLIGRLLLAALFFAGGLPKLLGNPVERKAIAGLGLPAAGFLERLSGACLIIGAAMLAAGLGTRVAAGLLAAFVIFVTFLFHRFWAAEEPQERFAKTQAFLANVGIVGGLVALAGMGPGFIALIPQS